MRTKESRPEPTVRNDNRGKWRLKVEYGKSSILTSMSWNTKKQAVDWVRWNNFDEGLYGEIVLNPEIY